MLICLSGYKGSGKDALANYLIENHKSVRVALADPLKDNVAREYGIDREWLDDPKKKEFPLLNMPVDPKDQFSRMIAEFMFKEFRSKHGLQPNEFYWSDHGFLGVFHNKGFNGEDTKGNLYDVLYQTPRSLAILKGSVNRSVTSDYWTKKAFESIEHHLNYGRTVVVTDVRYKSEVAQFKEQFGEEAVFVRINRFKESSSQDPSEVDLNDHEFDFYVDNTGSLENAYGQMEEILERIK